MRDKYKRFFFKARKGANYFCKKMFNSKICCLKSIYPPVKDKMFPKQKTDLGLPQQAALRFAVGTLLSLPAVFT